ncbi:alpha/beta hydrolase fold domain-containing protein [Sphingomonas sp. KR1UV-12]|uniref:Alpha/beta hydrolase fold domain-containing protein n=1 Tax=Sphingomonas aurea TaxID=3063994 RepID=A0ABT9EJM7_9SPHN|nr:alpha/beta hydrolase fold domain-containing protein [Sphingomonas sp. KR1UV-12]MDP1026998.1 alpha/beta hydrolase fold domain-containing protein [Sphingomonas sp. KR1UV-12]
MACPPEHARWVSPTSRTFFDEEVRAPSCAPADLEERRGYYDAINTARLAGALRDHPMTVTSREIAGVLVHEVVPAQPCPDGVLICLHGGAFLWGAGAGAVLEAVPVAAATGMRVLAVDYRLAPEYLFPNAVDDAAAVYAALIDADIGPIGIYGCSAGAYLTAQVVARLVTEGRPLPAAIALLHGSGMEVGGDSLSVAAQLNGSPAAADIQRMHDLPYFAGTDPADPLVFPGEHPAILASFPPSLLVTGTRDFAASSASVMHRRLVAAGVDARFFLFDGMWHAHHVDTLLPESKEVYQIMAGHFGRHLHRK